jgi:Calx-beta domain
VPYTTLSGTATQARDGKRALGAVTFATGETTKTITVTVIGDRRIEPNETFSLIGIPIGTGTIIDDDWLLDRWPAGQRAPAPRLRVVRLGRVPSAPVT